MEELSRSQDGVFGGFGDAEFDDFLGGDLDRFARGGDSGPPRFLGPTSRPWRSFPACGPSLELACFNLFNSFIQALAVLGLALALGCASVKPKAPRHDESPAASIDQINLLAVPVALNFDQAPGLDGFVVKIYAGNRSRAKP